MNQLGPLELVLNDQLIADIRDDKAVGEAARDCDLVLHLAANPNLWARDPGEFEQVNHQGTRHVLAAARSEAKELLGDAEAKLAAVTQELQASKARIAELEAEAKEPDENDASAP